RLYSRFEPRLLLDSFNAAARHSRSRTAAAVAGNAKAHRVPLSLMALNSPSIFTPSGSRMELCRPRDPQAPRSAAIEYSSFTSSFMSANAACNRAPNDLALVRARLSCGYSQVTAGDETSFVATLAAAVRIG